METIEIYLHDLNDSARQDVLSFLKMKDGKEGNLDVMPLFILEETQNE